MTEVILDFETVNRGGLDLRKVGAARYAEDIMTEVLTLKFKADGRMMLWTPHQARHSGPVLHELARTTSVYFITHGAFEQFIWQHIMCDQFAFPPLGIRRWHDTQASCAMKCWPLDLERALHTAGLPVMKDMEGRKITLGLSKADKHGKYPEVTPAVLDRVADYNEIDVVGTDLLFERLGPLPPSERHVWIMDQEINQRGVAIDLDFVKACQEIVKESSAPLTAEFQSITGLKPTQTVAFLNWCIAEGAWWLADLKKTTIAEELGEDHEGTEGGDIAWADGRSNALPDHVRRALAIRSLVGSASVKKLDAMARHRSTDGRARGTQQYYAAGTGRFGGRGPQFQNLPRGTVKINGEPPEPELVVRAIKTRDCGAVVALGLYCEDADANRRPAHPIEVVSSALRHALVPTEGMDFVSGDYSAIEAKIVLALAGQHDRCAEWAAGTDMYLRFADLARIPGQRQKGKGGVLGCGFQCGPDRFNEQFLRGKDLPTAELCVETYRKTFAPKVPRLWKGLEDAALTALFERKPAEYAGVVYELEDGWLTASLPSGGKLWYWNPQAGLAPMPWDETDLRPAWTYWTRKSGRMVKMHAYGGIETENVVQRLARDLLVEAMKRCQARMIPMVLTCHDELVIEMPSGKDWRPMLSDIMEEMPPWASRMGVPVAVETWQGKRYRK